MSDYSRLRRVIAPIISTEIDSESDAGMRCRKIIYIYKCGLIDPPGIERCAVHLDTTKWACQHPTRVLQYLSVDCTGVNNPCENHTHRPQPAQDVKRADFKSYFDYLAAKWQVPGHCRQVCYTNSSCGKIHFHALDCRRKTARPRRDQSCCGKREWILDNADEKCKHPECLSKRARQTWWSKITNSFR
jgi:hypothetical protein